jgi:hypothetical protein
MEFPLKDWSSKIDRIHKSDKLFSLFCFVAGAESLSETQHSARVTFLSNLTGTPSLSE